MLRIAPKTCGALTLSLCFLAPQAGAEQPLFASDAELDLTLALPLRTLLRQRSQRDEYPAKLTHTGADGAVTELDVEIRTRGRSRLELCTFPPLSVDVPRRQAAGTVFEDQNRIKLVTLCRQTGEFEQYFELEYLIYKMYEQVSDYAYRVRRARMRYVDTDRDNEVQEAPAFFIEHAEGLAARVGMTAADVATLSLTDFSTEPLAVYALFQFLIGNTDWSVTAAAEGDTCCHNTDVLVPSDGSVGTIAVPYDFDQAGFINTSYAMPAEQLRLRAVTQRLYRGFCDANGMLDGLIARFNAARPAIDALLQTDRLTSRSRSHAVSFIAGSFEILNDPARRQSDLVGRCRS